VLDFIVAEMVKRSKIHSEGRKRGHAFHLGKKVIQKFIDEYGAVICSKIQSTYGKTL
jgi:hypothetical protein